MRRWVGFVLTAASLVTPAHAREWQPEYQSLTEEEQSDFDSPARLGREYQSDILTYTKPDSWEYEWLSRDRAIDASVGSVSAAHFIIDNRLKIRGWLTNSLELRYTYVDERSRERETLHHILELDVWPWKNLGLALYGEPGLFKREDDTGIALLWKPSERHEVRLFNTFVDVTRMKRNDLPDKFVEPDLPYARGLVGRLREPGEGEDRWRFFEYALRYETKTRWIFPTEAYEYQYWKAFASLYGSLPVAPLWRVTGRAQYDRKFEHRFPTSGASLIARETWLTDRFTLLGRAGRSGLGPSASWEAQAGVEYAYRRWLTDGAEVIYRDVIPHGNVRFPAFGEGETRDVLEVGYDFTWHRVSGPVALLDPHDLDGVVEHRLNLTYEFSFKDRAKIRLIITGDLDQFLERGMWEGGNGQFSYYF